MIDIKTIGGNRMEIDWQSPNRREVMLAGTVGVAAMTIAPRRALATPDQVAAEIANFTGGKPLIEDRITLDLPSIAENGLVVPLNFEVASPMTDHDYVTVLRFFAEGNPFPQVADFYFTPLAAKAAGQIRIRLAQTQNIIAVAQMSDGTFYTAKQEVKVTIGGCGG